MPAQMRALRNVFFETTGFASNACAFYGRKIRYVRNPKGFIRSDVYAVRADKGLRPLINPGVFRQSPAEKQSFSAVFYPLRRTCPSPGLPRNAGSLRSGGSPVIFGTCVA